MPTKEQILISALKLRNLSMIEQTLEQGIDMAILASTELGIRVFMAAAKARLMCLISNLYGFRVPVDFEDEDGFTALICASQEHHDVVHFLLEKGADVNRSNKYREATLQIAANVNAIDEEGHTPLHEAIRCGQQNVVQTLLEGNARIGILDMDGNDALHLAMMAHRPPALDMRPIIELLQRTKAKRDKEVAIATSTGIVAASAT
ncbi:hypothetical protein LTR84_007485 [Exophiala bonariae]|uniref:Uncharacterized protein n=1 Tax=Exophiala bonariae TaxID=1690606 RepID=A0AAV9N1M3_9EURO|nr:hypothetical protein LTR84_007485 [Exophiala bonariae]